MITILKIARIAFVLLISGLVLPAVAEVNSLLYTPVLPHPDYDNKVGDIVWVDTSYDTDTKILRFIVKFKRNSLGKLPDGFKFAINGTGDNPVGHAGELAYFYFEALNQSDPKLLVYAYNGGHRSWRCCKGSCAGCSGICQPGDPSPPPE
ncbi:MAG: hypothetical protein KDD62_05670, partial [Bdellovibrionales bacterium]|nr:hypothetical protein [Bdellovibrionales bacterium]